MRIGELARRAGVSQRALRYYEEQDLLRPGRRLSGYREYSEADVHTVRDIRTLLAAGLGTATIAEVLPCMVKDGGQLVAPCGDLLELLARERDRIDSAVRELMSARGILDAIIVASGSGECRGEGHPNGCARGRVIVTDAPVGRTRREEFARASSGDEARARTAACGRPQRAGGERSQPPLTS